MSYMIPLGANSKRRIDLKETEILLFKELFVHRVMQSRDIHEFINAVSDKPPTANALSNRLTRLVKCGLLSRLEEMLDANRPSVKWYYYRLTRKGLMVLVQIGYLSEDNFEETYKLIRSSLIPKAHNQALSTLVNSVRVEGIKANLYFNHYRGALWAERHNVELSFIPDWVFEKNEDLIFLEVDSGSERLSVIEQKAKRYIEYARDSTEKVVVVFSIVDSSVYRLSLDDRSKRISSLKEVIPSINEWPDNLHFYVLSADRTTLCIQRLLNQIEPLANEYRGYVVDEWVDEWVKAEDYTYEVLTKNEVYKDDHSKQLEADIVIRFKDEDGTRCHALLYGEEGSVKTYQQIRSNHIRTTKTIPGVMRLDGLIIIYNDYELLTNEVHGIQTWNQAWFTFRDTWQHTGENGTYPKMLKPISLYRKEWVSFE